MLSRIMPLNVKNAEFWSQKNVTDFLTAFYNKRQGTNDHTNKRCNTTKDKLQTNTEQIDRIANEHTTKDAIQLNRQG